MENKNKLKELAIKITSGTAAEKDISKIVPTLTKDEEKVFIKCILEQMQIKRQEDFLEKKKDLKEEFISLLLSNTKSDILEFLEEIKQTIMEFKE